MIATVLRRIWAGIHSWLCLLYARVAGKRAIRVCSGLQEIDPETPQWMFNLVVVNAAGRAPGDPPLEVILTPENVAGYCAPGPGEQAATPAQNDPAEAWRRVRAALRECQDWAELTVCCASRRNRLKVDVAGESDDRIRVRLEESGPVPSAVPEV